MHHQRPAVLPDPVLIRLRSAACQPQRLVQAQSFKGCCAPKELRPGPEGCSTLLRTAVVLLRFLPSRATEDTCDLDMANGFGTSSTLIFYFSMLSVLAWPHLAQSMGKLGMST